MVGVKKVRFVDYNWGTPKLVIVDGINPAAVYNGTTYTQFTASSAPPAPKYVDAYKNHLFFAGMPTEPSNLYFASPFTDGDFNPANGAGVINVGFPIVQLKQFRDILYIFGKNEIKQLKSDMANLIMALIELKIFKIKIDEDGNAIYDTGKDGK
jgi:hypothetical protein